MSAHGKNTPARAASQFPPALVSRVEGRLLDSREGFMSLELDGGKLLSFPVEDARTERACRAGLDSGDVFVVIEMHDDVPLKVVSIETRLSSAKHGSA